MANFLSRKFNFSDQYPPLELIFLGKILANQGFEDIIVISQFVDPACVKNVSKRFCMHTLPDT
jgi:hypothetical protein